jgi:hypothetical protein
MHPLIASKIVAHSLDQLKLVIVCLHENHVPIAAMD